MGPIMPEGPEIRRAADKIASVLEGQVVESVKFGIPRLRRYNKVLTGNKVTRLETRGKALLTHFDNDWSIYSHNQLYGVWKVVKRGKLPATNRSLRLALHTTSHSALLYSASDISVWPSAEINQHPFLQRIGPDILDQELHWRDIAGRLLEPPFRRRTLATLYLDQAYMAGIGNYLRSEILYAARLHPELRPESLGRGQLGELARQTLSISRRSYNTGGITNPPRRAAALKKRGLSREKARFAVFGRAGRPCHECGDEIQRVEANSRRLYFCPTCQVAN